jgi:hypothetical protein
LIPAAPLSAISHSSAAWAGWVCEAVCRMMPMHTPQWRARTTVTDECRF